MPEIASHQIPTQIATAPGRVRNYTNEQWEAALRKAKQRTKSGEWPVIKSDDF